MKVIREFTNDQNELVKVTVFDIAEATYTGQDMGERKITATIKHESVIDFKIGDYIELDVANLLGGNTKEKFYIFTLPTIKKTARSGSVGDAFEHTVTFYPAQYELTITQMRDVMQQLSVQEITGQNFIYTGYDEFSFWGGAHTLMRRIITVLQERFGDNGVAGIDYWDYQIAEAVDEDINNALESFQFDFQGNSIWESLLKLNEEDKVNTDFFIVNRMIYVGFKRPHIVSVDNYGTLQRDPFNFKYGKTSHLPLNTNYGNLFSITKSIGNKSPITRLYVHGDSRNLNRFYASDRLRSGRYVSKLMLPSFGDDGKTDYIESIDGIRRYGIREASKGFDDIYPTLRYITYKDLRQVKFVIMIKNSGLQGTDDEIDSNMALARVQCYKVMERENGTNYLVESYPDDDLVICTHATGKIVKCVLFTSRAKQLQNDPVVPKRSDGSYIDGACFCAQNDNFNDYINAITNRNKWFTDPQYEQSDDMAFDIEKHQIQYTDDFWVTDCYLMDWAHPYDDQAHFPRTKYSVYCYPHINERYNGGTEIDDLLINEIVGVEPVTKVDTDMNKEDGTGQKYFMLYMRDFGFMIDEQAYSGQFQWLVGGEFQINFIDGYLAGLSFTVSSKDDHIVRAYNEDGSFNEDWYFGVDYECAYRALHNGAFWRLRCLRNTDNDYSWMPNTIINPQVGDHVVFLNIYMPDLYILSAEQRLLREAQRYLNDNDNGDVSYSVELDKIRLAQIPEFGLQMREGAVMRIVDDDLQIYTDNEAFTLCDYNPGLYAEKDFRGEHPIAIIPTTQYTDSNTFSKRNAPVTQHFDLTSVWDSIANIGDNEIKLSLSRGGASIEPKSTSTIDITNKGLDITWQTPITFVPNTDIYQYGLIITPKELGVLKGKMVFRQPFNIRSNKYYRVEVDVYIETEGAVQASDTARLVLLTSVTPHTTIFDPQAEQIDYQDAGNNFVRIVFAFNTETSFNDRQDYYIAIDYEARTSNTLMKGYLRSIKESNTQDGDEYAKYMDLTIDSLTIKLSDSSNEFSVGVTPHKAPAKGSSSKIDKEIQATIKERQKASTWMELSNSVKDTVIANEYNKQTAEILTQNGRKTYREFDTLRSTIFDPDGTINDVFLQTMLLQIGANSMNYTLDKTRIFNGKFTNVTLGQDDNGWYVSLGDDILRHFTYKNSLGYNWNITNPATFRLDDNKVYYVSFKCERDGNNGEWVVDTKQHKVDEEEGYYYFNYGIIGALDGSYRDFVETRGNVFVYGDNVRAGKILTMSGDSYFDLSGNEFKLGDQLYFKDGILHIGQGGNDINELLNDLSKKAGGENLYLGDSVITSSFASSGDYIQFVKLANGVAGREYIAYYRSKNITFDDAGFSALLNDVCVVATSGKPSPEMGELRVVGAYDFFQPFEMPSGATEIWIAFCDKDYFNNPTPLFFDNECGAVTTLTDVMLQEGEKATGYQTATKYLTDAITNGSTEIAGGLTMTNVLMLKNEQGQVTAGMSGLTANAENVLLWGGGTYQQANFASQDVGYAKSTNSPDPITTLLKKDGTGKLGVFEIAKDDFGEDCVRVYSQNSDRTNYTQINKNAIRVFSDNGTGNSTERITIYNGKLEESFFNDERQADTISINGNGEGSFNINNIYSASELSFIGISFRATLHFRMLEMRPFRPTIYVCFQNEGGERIRLLSQEFLYEDIVLGRGGNIEQPQTYLKNIYIKNPKSGNYKFVVEVGYDGTGVGANSVYLENISAVGSIKYTNKEQRIVIAQNALCALSGDNILFKFQNADDNDIEHAKFECKIGGKSLSLSQSGITMQGLPTSMDGIAPNSGGLWQDDKKFIRIV